MLTFGWDEPAEATHKYRAALFTDKEGEPVQQSPEFTLDAKFPTPIFTFGGLEPSTTYQLAVQTISTTDGVEDSPYVFLESRTTAAQTATPSRCVSTG